MQIHIINKQKNIFLLQIYTVGIQLKVKILDNLNKCIECLF